MLNNTFQQEQQQSGFSGTRIGKGCLFSAVGNTETSYVFYLIKHWIHSFCPVSNTLEKNKKTTLHTSVSIRHLCIYTNGVLLKQHFNTKYLYTVHPHLLTILLQNMTFHIKLHWINFIQTCQWAYSVISTVCVTQRFRARRSEWGRFTPETVDLKRKRDSSYNPPHLTERQGELDVNEQ